MILTPRFGLPAGVYSHPEKNYAPEALKQLLNPIAATVTFPEALLSQRPELKELAESKNIFIVATPNARGVLLAYGDVQAVFPYPIPEKFISRISS